MMEINLKGKIDRNRTDNDRTDNDRTLCWVLLVCLYFDFKNLVCKIRAFTKEYCVTTSENPNLPIITRIPVPLLIKY